MSIDTQHAKRLVIELGEVLGLYPPPEAAHEHTDDPATSPLNPDGSWQPPMLMYWVNKANQQFPNGVKPVPSHNFTTGFSSAYSLVSWPDRLFASASLYDKYGNHARNDLTEVQKLNLHAAHTLSFTGGIVDSGSMLVFHSVGNNVTAGGYPIAVGTLYTFNPERLARDIERYFTLYVGVQP